MSVSIPSNAFAVFQGTSKVSRKQFENAFELAQADHLVTPQEFADELAKAFPQYNTPQLKQITIHWAKRHNEDKFRKQGLIL